MSDFIPSCSWEDFCKIVAAGRLSELKSCEVLFPEHLCTVIVFHGDAFAMADARVPAEYLASRTNIEAGKYPNELLAEIEKHGVEQTEPTLHDKRVAAMAHAREARKQKQLAPV